MENASKALIMAGGVLIAILLATLFVYLFRQMASSTSNVYSLIEKHEIDEFNQKFLNYEGREDLVYQDVATLINLAENAEKNSKFKIKVEIKLGNTTISDTSRQWLEKNISKSNNKNEIKVYKCEKVQINPDTLLVDEVVLSE